MYSSPAIKGVQTFHDIVRLAGALDLAGLRSATRALVAGGQGSHRPKPSLIGAAEGLSTHLDRGQIARGGEATVLGDGGHVISPAFLHTYSLNGT